MNVYKIYMRKKHLKHIGYFELKQHDSEAITLIDIMKGIYLFHHRLGRYTTNIQF
jgi:hypothetical protein